MFQLIELMPISINKTTNKLFKEEKDQICKVLILSCPKQITLRNMILNQAY